MARELLLGMLLWGTLAAAATKVGNGDDGADLESGTPLTEASILEAKALAVKRLEALGVRGIPSLGGLIPETEGARLVMAKTDVEARLADEEGPYHVNLTGKVYARTFPEPHAATRFFPAALKLDRDQLVALHIHEALHRALPEGDREDEAVVSEITLALTASDASYDRVRRTVTGLIPEAVPMSSGPGNTAPVVEHFKNPSEIGYRYTLYRTSPGVSQFPVQAMHEIHSELYPFGGVNTPLGLGLEASLVRDGKGSHMGPLGLSARLRAWSVRDFSVGFWGTASLNTLSADELRNSPFGRDVYSVGLSLRKDIRHLYVENRIGISFGGQALYRVGQLEYQYDYGHVWDVQARAGFRVWKLDIGGFGEVHLADHLHVSGGAFDYDSGRYRIVSAGPEVSLRTDEYFMSVFGRFLIDSTKGASFDYLGNLMGAGAAQGGVGLSAGFFF